AHPPAAHGRRARSAGPAGIRRRGPWRAQVPCAHAPRRRREAARRSLRDEASPLPRVSGGGHTRTGREGRSVNGRNLAFPTRNTGRNRFPSRRARVSCRPGERPAVCYPAARVQIGQLLIEQGYLTREGLEEALDWQVLYGGRLGTNLLELQLVEEEQLARALGKQLGAEVAWGELQVDPAVVSAVPKHVADRQEMVPWKLEKRRLKVLCCEIKVGDLDQLSYKVGRTCVPVVAPEFRIFQLLRLHYQATRQMRALDFGVVPEEGRASKRKKAKDVEKVV